MRKTFLLAMILLVSAAWAVAQQDPNAPPSAQNPSAQRPNAQPPDTEAPPPTPSGDTIEGCLGWRSWQLHAHG